MQAAKSLRPPRAATVRARGVISAAAQVVAAGTNDPLRLSFPEEAHTATAVEVDCKSLPVDGSSGNAPTSLLCPSAKCGEGALLIGIIGPDGNAGFLRPALTVDSTFVETARQGQDPEHRFRFAAPCLETSCAQWTGTRCGVIDKATFGQPPATGSLPACAVRSRCRWHAQSGLAACETCASIFRFTHPPATAFIGD